LRKQVLKGLLQKGSTFLKSADATITVEAQYATHLLGGMVMIDAWTFIREVGCATDLTPTALAEE
jgi:hypothetical protein